MKSSRVGRLWDGGRLGAPHIPTRAFFKTAAVIGGKSGSMWKTARRSTCDRFLTYIYGWECAILVWIGKGLRWKHSREQAVYANQNITLQCFKETLVFCHQEWNSQGVNCKTGSACFDILQLQTSPAYFMMSIRGHTQDGKLELSYKSSFPKCGTWMIWYKCIIWH